MHTPKFITTTTLAALLGSFSLLACGGSEVEPADQSQSAGLAQQQAQNAPAPEAMRPEARGPRDGHRFGPPSPEKLIARFDANKNGQLEASELPERLQQRIGDIDTNHDGVVSKDELDAHFKAKFAEHAAEFAARAKERFDSQDKNHDGALDASELGAERWARLSVADANGDQKLTPDELKAAFQAGKIKPSFEHGDFAARAKERFERKDTNHDGTLEQSEVGPERWARLSVADTNGDQKLTPDELKAAFQAGKIKPMMGHGHWRNGEHDAAPPADAPAAPAAPAPAAPSL